MGETKRQYVIKNVKMVRRIISFGRDSSAVLLPPLWLKKIKVRNGDHVRLSINEKEQSITVHKIDYSKLAPELQDSE